MVETVIILARNGDGEDSGWSQILVFVVLAAFWLVGGIMKAKNEKANRQKQNSQGDKPVFRKPLFQPAPASIARQIGLKPKAPAEKAKKESLKPVEMAGAVKRAERKVTKSIAESAEDVFEIPKQIIPDDPEQLKAAILHYEILGKPIALREGTRY